jgi:hypothetical protein
MSFLSQAYLIEKYGLRLTLDDVGRELGVSAGSIRNQISEDRFPVPSYVDQGRRWVDYRDLAEHLDSLRPRPR